MCRSLRVVCVSDSDYGRLLVKLNVLIERRVTFKCCFKSGLSAKNKALEMLQTAYGKLCLHKTSVYD